MDEMVKYPGLKPRDPDGIYYYRVTVPEDVVSRVGTRDRWRSLGTRDRAEAVRRYHEKAAEWHMELAEHRRRQNILKTGHSAEAVRNPVVSTDEAMAMAQLLVAQTLASPDFGKPRWAFEEKVADDIEFEIDSSLANLENLDHPDGNREVFHTAARLFRQHRQEEAGSLSSEIELFRHVRRALIALAKEERARFGGDLSGNMQDALFTDISISDQAVQRVARPRLTVQAAADKFWRERVSGQVARTKTEQKYRAALDRVVEFFGADTPIADVTRDDCVTFRDVISVVPANFSKRFAEDLTLRQIGLTP